MCRNSTDVVSTDSFLGRLKLGTETREKEENIMAKMLKKKAKTVRRVKAKRKPVAKRSGAARRKVAVKRSRRPTARKSRAKARRKAA